MLSLLQTELVSKLFLILGFTSIALLVIGAILRLWLGNHPLDAHEPPIVRPTVPYVGHLWGLMKYSHEYLADLW